MKKILLAVIILALFSYTAESQEIQIRNMWIRGTPQIMKVGSSSWQELDVDTPIHDGDRIKTGSDDVVELGFAADEDNNMVRIEEGSDVLIKIGRQKQSVEIMNGAAYVLIKNLPVGSTFEAKTPTAISGARGTAWRAAGNSASSSFSVFEKSVSVRGIDKAGNPTEGELLVDSGFKTTVDKFEKPSGLERLTEAEMERFNSVKQEMAGRSGGSAEENKGKDALDRAGAMGENAGGMSGSIKEDTNQARDLERIEKRLEAEKEPVPEPDTTYHGG